MKKSPRKQICGYIASMILLGYDSEYTNANKYVIKTLTEKIPLKMKILVICEKDRII